MVLNGAIMGIARGEMLRRMQEIEAFADIGEFFDQPVKTYSSGMYVRVAFAAAIHVDPEILIVDEALSVGDSRFQHRCYQKIRAYMEQERPFWSFHMQLIRCSESATAEWLSMQESGTCRPYLRGGHALSCTAVR